MIDLTGKTALITGASRGIGRSCAVRLAECGANIAINFLSSRQAATKVAREINEVGGNAIAIKADVCRQEDSHALVEAVAKRFGSIDIIVSNAAAGGFGNVADLKESDLEAVLKTNTAPVAWLAQASIQWLGKNEQQGKFVAVSSCSASRAIPNNAVIGASKAAMESLVRHLALEFGQHGINFNCVMPGIVATEAVRSTPQGHAVIEAAQKKMLIGDRALEPRSIADVVSFLASPLSDFIQGQTVVVDGGITIRI